MSHTVTFKSDPKSVLLLPGWNGSGEQHWQSIWQRKFGFRRIEQVNWSVPCRQSWINSITEEIGRVGSPVHVVAHSLGCLALAHVAFANPHAVRHIDAALMVAPPDLDTPASILIRNFGHPPRKRLPFRSTLVASKNDRYMDEGKAEELASVWGSEYVNAGPVGHINCEAGFGPWERGEMYLEQCLFPIHAR